MIRYSGVNAILKPEIEITELSFILGITVDISTALRNNILLILLTLLSIIFKCFQVLEKQIFYDGLKLHEYFVFVTYNYIIKKYIFIPKYLDISDLSVIL